MKDISIIIPLHKFDDSIEGLLKNAFQSIKKNQENYKFGKLIPLVVGPNQILEEFGEKFGEKEFYHTCRNNKKTDFCSQINHAVKKIKTEYFSILEFDDTYTDKWFKMAHDYYFGNEDVSLFLPINILSNNNGDFQFGNEIAWAASFTNELGYIDYDCLSDYYTFNLTGGIFKTEDFVKVGGFKPSIKVSFNYELLLRMTSKKLRIFVVPKEGYHHVIGRKDSLTEKYNKEISDEDIPKWFKVAKMEYAFTEDRNIDIKTIVDEKIK